MLDSKLSKDIYTPEIVVADVGVLHVHMQGKRGCWTKQHPQKMQLRDEADLRCNKEA